MKSIVNTVCTLIPFVLWAIFLLQDDRVQVQQRAGKVRNSLRKHTGQHRIAVVIPLAGNEIPPYLSLFCQAARGSAALVDFVIVHTGALEGYAQTLPENVRFVNLESTKALAERLVRVASDTAEDETLVKLVTRHVQQYPYVLVEFKPALGYIFREELKGYSHWAYSDIDIAFGDLPRWITNEELTDFDIVTYGFGDQDRVYLRGQFTIHKNTDRVNELWRGCDYLSNMAVRYENAVSGKEKIKFESAEGSYSAAIMQQTDIRVKYAVKAFTDVKNTDTAYTHGLYIGIGQHRDRSVIYKATSDHEGRGLISLSPTWFEAKHNVYANKTNPLQKEVGPRIQIELNADKHARCMYWVQEKYQSALCLKGVQSTDTVFWIDGKLYKQSHVNTELPGSIISAPFFHFQEWKRNYRSTQLATIDRAHYSLTWILTKEGAIPAHHTTISQTSRAHLSPLGVQPLPLRWRGAKQTYRNQLPHHFYCVRSGPRKFPPIPPAPGCERMVSWQDQHAIEILNGAFGWKHVNINEDVTLVLTLQLTATQASNRNALGSLLDLTVSNINVWEGQPCVLVIHMSGATPEAIVAVADQMKDLTDMCLIALIVNEKSDLVSRKALMNMASDAAPTRWVISGVEIERGMILSSEASVFANRRAKILGSESSANVFIIPQFGVNDDGDVETSLSISELMEVRNRGIPHIKDPAEFEKGSCEDALDNPNAVFSAVHKLWWRLTASEIAGGIIAESSDSLMSDLVVELEKIQTSFATMLTSEMLDNLALVDISPILMVDNMGPQKGTRTSNLVREVEEFGGKQCYNILRLAQLAVLGYSIDVLPGAFALSSFLSRKVAMEKLNEDVHGASRCDACFMFDEEHDEILDDIAHDEQTRTAKTAIVWNELNSQPGMSRSIAM